MGSLQMRRLMHELVQELMRTQSYWTSISEDNSDENKIVLDVGGGYYTITLTVFQEKLSCIFCMNSRAKANYPEEEANLEQHCRNWTDLALLAVAKREFGFKFKP